MKPTHARDRMQARYGTHLNTANIRRVWAAITDDPRASRRELAERVGLSHGSVAGALRLLNDAGYISFPPRAARAVTIIIPFKEIA